MTKKEAWSFIKIIFRRFVKSFLAGGLAGLAVYLSTNPIPVLSDLGQLKTWSITLSIAFLAGALMALEKALQGYKPTN